MANILAVFFTLAVISSVYGLYENNSFTFDEFEDNVIQPPNRSDSDKGEDDLLKLEKPFIVLFLRRFH